MIYYTATDQNRREENQDSSLCADIRVNHEAAVSVYCVADGMGGLLGGKMYSKDAIREFYQRLMFLLTGDEFVEGSLEEQLTLLETFSSQVYKKINRVLYQRGMDLGYQGGTTLSVAIHFWDTWFLSNCGDSPIYVRKDKKLRLASQIQNEAGRLIREGKTNLGSPLYYMNKNRLLQYLGQREEVMPAVSVCKDDKVDQLLLGTDGAFGDCSLGDLETILDHGRMDRGALRRIFEKSKDRREEDNQTAILIVNHDRRERKNHAPEKKVSEEKEVLEKRDSENQIDKESQVETIAYRKVERESRLEKFGELWNRRRRKKDE